MWIEKLSRGVLELETAIGPRFLNPSLVQRVRLMWTFRNFSSLPHQVLRSSELRLIDRLSNANRFVSRAIEERPVIGKVEARVEKRVEAKIEERSDRSVESRADGRAAAIRGQRFNMRAPIAAEEAPLRKLPVSAIAASRQNVA
jgi:hypothetical protein